MAHRSTAPLSTQLYGLLSVLVLVTGVTASLLLKPHLFSASIPYSLYGTLDQTKYLFSGSLILAGLLFLYETHFVGNTWQRRAGYLVPIGFTIVALLPINQSMAMDLLHGLGVLLALIGLLISMAIGAYSRFPYLGVAKRFTYTVLFGVALAAAVLSILSNGRVGIVSLQGYAEYSGLAVYAAWIILDFGDNLMLKTT